MKNIWADKRSWNYGMIAFFGVHLVLTVVSLTLDTIIGVLGIRALRAKPRSRPAPADRDHRLASRLVVTDPVLNAEIDLRMMTTDFGATFDAGLRV